MLNAKRLVGLTGVMAWTCWLGFVAMPAYGQCPSGWTPGGGPLPGLNGPV